MVYCIYKIVCNDVSVTDFYVGSTKCFRKRKWDHKYYCNTEKNKKYNKKTYQTIRANGGWDNWRMVIIEEMEEGTTKIQALIREEYYRVELQATLNMIKCATGLTKQEYKKEYNQTEKQKKYRKEYKQTNKEYKEKQKIYNKEYYKKRKEKNQQALLSQNDQIEII